MPVSVGAHIGPYEILQPLGAGGMGEVYRARDAKLHRDVAIKVLPELFSADPDRLARFRREAQVLASLNHQNIGHIYGLEDSAGVHALVLELVEGPTLADRIAQGPIPLDDAIPIARQIADALECAHEQGIIHRDLKPANIKLRPDGLVKVLDFGLAKALDPLTGSGSDAMNSPTLTARGTQLGVIVGTAAYMAPEQARGKPVDRRADIWAFGVVLYEMLSGKRAFEGDDVSITLAAVLKDDVNWKALPANLPASVLWVLRRCLEKDPKRRLSAIGDARLELEHPVLPDRQSDAAPARPRSWWSGVPWALGGAAVASAALLLAWAPWRVTPPIPSIMLSASPGSADPLVLGIGGSVALSPDGRTLAYVASEQGRRHVFLRRLDELQAARIAGTEDAFGPFFSPDGTSIAFFSNNELKRIPITGGTAVKLADANGPGARGGWWGEDGAIVFQPTTNPSAKLMRVAETGGTAAPLVQPPVNDGTQRWPQVLPGGRAVLYSMNKSTTGWDNASIVVQPLPVGTPRTLIDGGYHARYAASGHIFYILRGTLFAAPFDIERLELTGRGVPIVQEVVANTVTGGAQYSVSKNGTLAYVAGVGIGLAMPMSLMDEAGKTTDVVGAPFEWHSPRFSPNGDKIALVVTTDGVNDVHVYDTARQRLDKITYEAGNKTNPVWAPDGQRIVYTLVTPGAGGNLYWRRADGTGDVQQLTTGNNFPTAFSFDPTGTLLAFTTREGANPSDIMILPLEGSEATGWKPGTPWPFLKTTATETYPMFSPDGRWIAYMTTESGRPELYVRPFRGTGGPWQITSGGGLFPTWSRTRSEILYTPSTMTETLMAAGYFVEGASFRPGNPRRWSPTAIRPQGASRTFDLHRDGKRVVAAPAPAGTDTQNRDVVFVFNFFEKVKKLVAAGKT